MGAGWRQRHCSSRQEDQAPGVRLNSAAYPSRPAARPATHMARPAPTWPGQRPAAFIRSPGQLTVSKAHKQAAEVSLSPLWLHEELHAWSRCFSSYLAGLQVKSLTELFLEPDQTGPKYSPPWTVI